MTSPALIESEYAQIDPRDRRDFCERFYPKANGRMAPASYAKGRNERTVLEFLAAYYDLNCAYHGVLEARKTGDAAAEREQLRAMEQVLIVRDALEDRYAPLGVIAETVVHDGFAVDVRFSFGDVDAAGRRRTDRYRLAAFLPVPLPPGMELRNVPFHVEGPGVEGD